MYGKSTMADRVLYIIAKLGKCLCITIRHKDRIVSKTGFTFFLSGDNTINDSIEQIFLTIQNQGYYSTKRAFRFSFPSISQSNFRILACASCPGPA